MDLESDLLSLLRAVPYDASIATILIVVVPMMAKKLQLMRSSRKSLNINRQFKDEMQRLEIFA